MGQEIESSQFSKSDFEQFSTRLREETTLLEKAFAAGQFSEQGNVVGYEIEAWLVSPSGIPAPVNHTFLQQLDNPLVVHELAAFNVELNSDPLALTGKVFSIMEEHLDATWKTCQQHADELAVAIMMIGILPSVQERHLSMENMSKLNRYRALNEQLMKHRQGRPLQLDIKGRQQISTTHNNVMMESACTSLQLHLQTPLHKAARLLNLSSLLSGPMVAVSANSPYLFGKDLWDETRIPLFEQSVDIVNNNRHRVTFGDDYIHESIMESYHENLHQYPVLVPIDKDAAPEQFKHVAFHNGTIWRWNRPLIGFDDNQTAHLRIEHRVIPSGPSVTDSVANAALYFGLINGLEDNVEQLTKRIPFSQARHNFYQCAKHGLAADIQWNTDSKTNIKQLLLEELIPAATTGLQKCNVDINDIENYMGLIRQRVESGQNGASWQRQWVATHGHDMQRLTCSYLQRQNSGIPVHEWGF